MTTTPGATYNGWANYETWVTALWLSNDQGTDETARELVSTTFEDEDVRYPRVTAADALAAWVTDDLLPDLDGLACDLLGHAVESVDWLEVVDSFHDV